MKFKYLILLILFQLFITTANAENKIYYLDMNFIINNSDAGKVILKKIDEFKNQSMEDLKKETQEELNKSEENLENKKQSEAKQNQKKASKKMQEMSQKMQESMQSMSAEMEEENMEGMRQILENLITFSFDSSLFLGLRAGVG